MGTVYNFELPHALRGNSPHQFQWHGLIFKATQVYETTERTFLTIFFFFFRAQQLCESRGGRSGIPVPNSLSCLCGHKAAMRMRKTGGGGGGVHLQVQTLYDCWLLCVWTWACSSRETFDAFPAYAKTWIESIFAPTLLQMKRGLWVIIFLVIITCFELFLCDVLVPFLKS